LRGGNGRWGLADQRLAISKDQCRLHASKEWLRADARVGESPRVESGNDLKLPAIGAALQERRVKQFTINFFHARRSIRICRIFWEPRKRTVPDWISAELLKLLEEHCGKGPLTLDGGGALTLNLGRHADDESRAELFYMGMCIQGDPINAVPAGLPDDLRLELQQLGAATVSCRRTRTGGSCVIDVAAEPASVKLQGATEERIKKFLQQHLSESWQTDQGSFDYIEIDVAAGKVFGRKAELTRRVDLAWEWPGEHARN
jgi:hypothetical protein